MKKRPPVERPWYRDRAQFIRSEDERRWRETRETPNVVEFKVPVSAPAVEQPVPEPVVVAEPATVAEPIVAVEPVVEVAPTAEQKPWWKRLLRL